MKKYRIVKHTYVSPKFISSKGQVIQTEHVCYEVQKRFLGFLWWYNFNNIAGITTGIYDQLWEAEMVLQDKIKKHTHKKEIIKEM